jgi:DnaJ-class molecular chaperone
VVTQPGYVMTLRDEGMPHHEHPDEKGVMLVTFVVDFPAVLSAEQRTSFAALL